jgi:hypothetical protein
MARLWPLPLLAGLLPVVATALAWHLSVRGGVVPDCNPFLDGCVSISRSARHGLANVLFRALVLPAAALQAACWMLAPAWLASLGVARDRWVRALPALGVAAGVALVLYGSFLGLEGEGYRSVRRHAVPAYFGFTCICMLVVAQHAQRALAQRVGRVLLLVCLCLPLLGLVHVFVPLALAAEAQRNALENVTEWWAGAIFTAFFLALGWAWRRTDARLRLDAGDAP